MKTVAKWAKNMNSTLHHMSLKQRLIFYFLLLLFVSYLATGMFLNHSITQQMETVYTDFTRQTLSQAVLDLETRIGNIDRIMGVVLADHTVVNHLRSLDGSDGDEVRKLFASIKDQYPDILGIALRDREGIFLSNEMYQPETEAAVTTPWRLDAWNHGASVRFLSRPFGRNMAYYSPVSSDRILSVIKTIQGPDNAALGILCVDVDVETLKGALDRFKLGKDGFVYVLDPEGNVAYAPENPIVPRMKPEWFMNEEANTFSKQIMGVPYQIIFETSRYTGFKVVGVFPENETLQVVKVFRLYFFLIICLIMGLSLIGAQRISDTVVRPLQKLKELMIRAEKGDLNVSFNPQYLDEIGQLGLRFDQMIREIRNLITLVRKEQASKRRAELRALQAQINPHFLYNTFDTIHWMLKKYQADDVNAIIVRLTDLFRISLSGGRDIIPLSDELRHVEAYLAIQKVRYEEQLNFNIDVPETLKKIQVIKLTLQPIVENAIYHGLKNRESGGLIEITGEQKGERMVLTVRDNGPGISAAKLEALRIQLAAMEGPAENASAKGYGMYNVHERIRLSMGAEYGVELESDGMTGCTVRISYPVLYGGGDMHDD